MLSIFLSWSGERSRAMAEFLTIWLRKVIQNTKPWMSQIDIQKGKRWSEEIGKNLESHNIGIICVTPENYKASWLLFETGALSKSLGYSKICPLLLGISPTEISGPLSQFQATILEKSDIFKLIKMLNSELNDFKLDDKLLNDSFNSNWLEFENKIDEIVKIKIQGSRTKMSRVIKAFAKHGLPEPIMGDQAFFKNGFESHGLYSTLTEIAQNRLYIFGRKNRKLFDKEHSDFFDCLKEKIDNGLDFKILFLDPDAPKYVLKLAHQDNDLPIQLERSIEKAIAVLTKSNIDIEDHAKMYDIQRTLICIIVDDAILYTPISLDELGRAKKLTKAPFSVINAKSEFGEELLKMFDSHWACSNPINKNEGKTCQPSLT